MTDRTEDFHCPRCRKYLFSTYTYSMGKDEYRTLNEQAATQCNCTSKKGNTMRKIKIADAPNKAIDWLVAKAEGRILDGQQRFLLARPELFAYTTDPAQAWPIIEREKIDITYQLGHECWASGNYLADEYTEAHGDTSLVAAMRCYCTFKFGEEAEVPEELLS